MAANDTSVAQSVSRFPWYEIVEGDDLEQGDIFEKCPIFKIESPFSYVEVHAADFEPKFKNWEYDVIIMTQSCDLTKNHPKVEEVLLCAMWEVEELAQEYEFIRHVKGREEIRRGNVSGFHMLNASSLPEFERPIRVIGFQHVYSLPLTFLRSMAQARGPRLRLLPPYREHLGQAFARYFMRVGLPVDIPPFKK